jgi:hypothetical protein
LHLPLPAMQLPRLDGNPYVIDRAKEGAALVKGGATVVPLQSGG